MRAMVCMLVAACAMGQQGGEVQGSVVDSRGGEVLSNVRVQIAGTACRATTDSTGRFRISGVPAGDHNLDVSTVGYHMAKKVFHLDAGETKAFDVVLTPDTLRQTETVEVAAGPFETVRQDSPDALVLAGNDAKNLGSVLADDPLRAVQSLPGVASNNDFDARFSLRGADFSRVGLYLDGILLHEPFHMLAGEQSAQASATAFNADMVEEMELQEAAWPARYEDRSAGVLDVHTRDGSRDGVLFRVSASASNAGVMAEGPLGKKKRGSWLVASRKSYLQYIFQRTFPNTTVIFGFEDVQGRLSYDLDAHNHLTLYVLESYSTLDRGNRATLGVDSLAGGAYHYTLGNAGWRSTPGAKWLINTHAAWMREKYDDTNPSTLPLSSGFYGEWVGNTNATYMWSPSSQLDFGASVRQERESGALVQYQSVTNRVSLLDHSNGTAMQAGGYAQQSWTGLAGALHLQAGARWGRNSIDGVAAVSPQASAALALTKSLRLVAGWGQYAQFPEIAVLTSPLGNRNLPPIRSNQAFAGIEKRLGERTRLRLEYYNRADRDMTFQPLYYPRLLANGTIFTPPVDPQYVNSLRGGSHGIEIFLQRSSANRFTGWVSYAYGHSEMQDSVTLAHFPSDWDQRHTVNAYGGYRLRPSVNLSLKASYGSGFPIPGFFIRTDGGYAIGSVMNQVRLPAYMRLDARVNKSWSRDSWKVTLYGEVINLTNRTNYMFDSFNGYNSRTGQASLSVDTMFPILPSAGIVVER